MSFDSMMTDRLSLLKKDGSEVPGLKGSVQGSKIYIMNPGKVLIETGDLLRRSMSNGAEETFRVIEPGFHEGIHGIKAHYQMQVQKLGVPEAQQAVQSITYNIHGNNARINQHSVDNSVNVVNIDARIVQQMEALRAEIGRLQLSDAERADATDVLDTVDAQLASGKPKKSVVKALLGALPTVATVTDIVSTIVGMLS